MLALQDEHSAAFSPHLDRLLAATEAWAALPVRRVHSLEREDVPGGLIWAATDLEVAHSWRSAAATWSRSATFRWPKGR